MITSEQISRSMMTKTEQVVVLVKAGEWAKAMNIAKTFRLGFTKDEIRTIEIASDTLNGNGRLYRDLGIDVAVEVSKCKELLKKRYLH